jgi:hypothetical protein
MKTISSHNAYPTGDHNNIEPEYGISKLEYFAGIAMKGLITSAPNGNLGNSKEGCQLAVQWALDLINELNKHQS